MVNALKASPSDGSDVPLLGNVMGIFCSGSPGMSWGYDIIELNMINIVETVLWYDSRFHRDIMT